MSFYCNVLDCNVKVACNLKSCKFNINNKFSYNCLKYFIATSGNPNEAQLALFYNMPVDKVKAIYASALAKVREQQIKETIGSVRIKYVPNSKICVRCESYAETPVMIKTDDSYHVICNNCCVYPENIWAKAIKYETEPKVLLKLCFNLFKNHSQIDSFLNMPKGFAKRYSTNLTNEEMYE